MTFGEFIVLSLIAVLLTAFFIAMLVIMQTQKEINASQRKINKNIYKRFGGLK